MSRTQIMQILAALILATILMIVPAGAQEPIAGGSSMPVATSRVAFGIYGPYATIRRANEVAYYYRSLGFSTLAYHNGDGYYVRVW
jgi:hypothetical protein